MQSRCFQVVGFTSVHSPSTVLGKGGLGRENFVKERAEERKTQESHRLADFRQRKQGIFSLRRVEADIKKSQRACEQLDSAKV